VKYGRDGTLFIIGDHAVFGDYLITIGKTDHIKSQTGISIQQVYL